MFLRAQRLHTQILLFSKPREQSKTDMLSAIAYRSLAQAKAAHADIKVLAAGDSDAQQKAIQMLKVLKEYTFRPGMIFTFSR